MNKQFDIYTNAELKNFIDMAQKELANRKNKRFDELVKNACDALNTLLKEFPSVRCELNAAVECDYCDTDFDFWFDIFSDGEFTPNMFVNY